MGIYTPTIELTLKGSYVTAVAGRTGLPSPAHDPDGNFARLTKADVQRWIDASKLQNADKHVYLIGFVFEKYKYQCIIPRNEPENENADYGIVFA